MLNQISQTQRDYITLWYLVQHSLSSFYKLVTHFGSVHTALNQHHQWHQLNLHQSHLKRLQAFHTPLGQKTFTHILQLVHQYSDFIICLEDANYPAQLLPYADKPPLLFGQGNPRCLLEAQIAIVGSRKPSPHGRQTAYDFAYYLSEKGFYINSGLALGIDEAAHLAGVQNQRTLAVMATGLETTYPQQNKSLRQKIVAHDGAIITEFLPLTKPLQHHFPRRNRIVSALSLGIIVAEAGLKSGSLITAKIAAEQGKSIFAIPGYIYDEHHQGCHLLIREGASLVDHPEQVFEDLALATHWQHQQQIQETITPFPPVQAQHIPAHLDGVYQQLDWSGIGLDQLSLKLNLDTATLISQLMELELLGLCLQQSGVYLRCDHLQ